MTAVVVEAKNSGKKTTFKKYRLPEEKELKAAEVKKKIGRSFQRYTFRDS
jgi:hypothetical protein